MIKRGVVFKRVLLFLFECRMLSAQTRSKFIFYMITIENPFTCPTFFARDFISIMYLGFSSMEVENLIRSTYPADRRVLDGCRVQCLVRHKYMRGKWSMKGRGVWLACWIEEGLQILYKSYCIILSLLRLFETIIPIPSHYIRQND